MVIIYLEKGILREALLKALKKKGVQIAYFK